MRALKLNGRSVPADVSVGGYDDMPEAAFFIPSLTTVTYDFETAGRTCLEFLIGRGRRETTKEFIHVRALAAHSAIVLRTGPVFAKCRRSVALHDRCTTQNQPSTGAAGSAA